MQKLKLTICVAACLYATSALSYTQIDLEPTKIISDKTGAPAAVNAANKGKIIRLIDGTLVATYGDAVDAVKKSWNYSGDIYTARDIFITWSKDDGDTWSDPVNVSGTATQTDPGAFYDPDGNGSGGTGGIPPMNFYGDSDKPNIFAPGNGNNIMVSWTDKYCPSGLQGVAEYTAPYLSLDPGVIQVPFSCVYAARLVNSADSVELVAVDRLTDAERDAKSDVPRGGGGGNAIAWQEDPIGLQPGDAEGPGDGGSGAKTSNGTDIWYSYLANKSFATGNWSAPVRVTDNAPSEPGASRPNIFVAKHPESPGKAWTLLAYEERKGLDSLAGKYVVYHLFAFDDPTKGAVPAGQGIIISDPLENGRRVRFVAKGSPGSEQGTRIILLWKQGVEDQGGPSDIMARVGYVPEGWDPLEATTTAAGFRPQDMKPAVIGSGDPETALGNEQPLNLSSAELDDRSTDEPIDDARAHRAIIVDDNIVVGFSYTPDQAVARFTVEENYDFYVRRSFDGGQTWDEARNLSNLPKDRNAKEPRLVGTPGSVASTCPTGDAEAEDTTNAADCQDKAVYYVAWGTDLNQRESISEGAIDLDLYMSRTTDFGETYEPAVLMAEGNAELDNDEVSNGESQIRMTPDGKESYTTWMKSTVADGKEVVFVKGGIVNIGGGDGGGFCSYNPKGRFDPVLPLTLFAAIALIAWRTRKSSVKNESDDLR